MSGHREDGSYGMDKDRQNDCGLDGVEIAGQVPAGLQYLSPHSYMIGRHPTGSSKSRFYFNADCFTSLVRFMLRPLSGTGAGKGRGRGRGRGKRLLRTSGLDYQVSGIDDQRLRESLYRLCSRIIFQAVPEAS